MPGQGVEQMARQASGPGGPDMRNALLLAVGLVLIGAMLTLSAMLQLALERLR
jgi:hypothetical protein